MTDAAGITKAVEQIEHTKRGPRWFLWGVQGFTVLFVAAVLVFCVTTAAELQSRITASERRANARACADITGLLAIVQADTQAALNQAIATGDKVAISTASRSYTATVAFVKQAEQSLPACQNA